VETGSSKFREGLASAIPETKGCGNEVLNREDNILPKYFTFFSVLFTIAIINNCYIAMPGRQCTKG